MPQITELLSSSVEWIEDSGLVVSIDPDLRIEMTRRYISRPDVVVGLVNGHQLNGTGQRTVRFGRARVSDTSGVRLAVTGLELMVPSVRTSWQHSRDSDGSWWWPAVTLSDQDLRKPFEFAMTSELSNRDYSRKDVGPSTAVTVRAGGFDLSSGLELELPSDFRVDHVVARRRTFVDLFLERNSSILQRLSAALSSGLGPVEVPLDAATRWRDALVSVLQELIKTVEDDLNSIRTSGCPITEETKGSLDVYTDLLSQLGTESGILGQDLTVAPSPGLVLQSSVGRIRNHLAAFPKHVCFAVDLVDDRRVPAGQLPIGPYDELVIPFSTASGKLTTWTVIGSLAASALLLGMVAQRVGALYPLQTDAWNATTAFSDSMTTNREAFVAILVFVPAMLFSLVPNLIARAPLAERRAQGYYLSVTAVPILLPSGVAALSLAGAGTRFFTVACVIGVLALIGAAVTCSVLFSKAYMKRSRLNQSVAEVTEWGTPLLNLIA